MKPQDYIPKPCHENWNTMTGSEQQKFCDKCSCSVHNLTDMDHKQIMDLRSELGGNLCGTFQQQSQVATSAKLKKKIRRVHLRRSLVLGASISSLALAACQSEKDVMVAGESGSVYVPESETSPDDSKQPTKPIKLPVKPEVIMGIVCPEEEVKPPKKEPKIRLGEIIPPEEEVKLPKIKPQILGKISVPQKPRK